MSLSEPWAEVPLGEIADRVTVGHVGPMRTQYLRDGIPFLRSLNIEPFRIRRDQLMYVSRSFHESLQKSALRPGDVVVVRTGKPGTTAVVPEDLPEANCSDLVVITPGPKLDAHYLTYYLNSTAGRAGVRGRLVGSVQSHFNVGDARAFSVPLPPIGTQREIAATLRLFDDKIELNRQTNETLETTARAIFKSWFLDFDSVRAKMGGGETGLPGPVSDFFPARFVQSELGEIPEGWQVLSLDDIGRFVNGLALQKYPPTDGSFLPVIKIAQLRAGHTDGADRASADLEPDYVVEDGDILFSWSGSLECVLWAGGRGALNQHLFKVTSPTYPRWLCYFGIHEHLDEFRQIAAGKATTMGHIQRHHLSDAKLAVPGPELLRAADSVLAPMIESVWRREVESRTLAQLRDTLLPKLISGELPVQYGYGPNGNKTKTYEGPWKEVAR